MALPHCRYLCTVFKGTRQCQHKGHVASGLPPLASQCNQGSAFSAHWDCACSGPVCIFFLFLCVCAGACACIANPFPLQVPSDCLGWRSSSSGGK